MTKHLKMLRILFFIFHIKAEAVKKENTALVYKCCLKAIQSIWNVQVLWCKIHKMKSHRYLIWYLGKFDIAVVGPNFLSWTVLTTVTAHTDSKCVEPVFKMGDRNADRYAAL